LICVQFSRADAEEIKIMSLGEWAKLSKEKHDRNATSLANALAAEGWELMQFSRAGILLRRTGNAYKVKIYTLGDWRGKAMEEYSGNSTRMANALASEGWEILQYSASSGIILKRTGKKHEVKLMGISEWKEIAQEEHNDNNTKMATALGALGWEISQFTMDRIILKKTGKKLPVKVMSIDEWNLIAQTDHDGDDTNMANALASKGWEISDLSPLAIILEKSGRLHEARIMSLSEFDNIAETKHGGSFTAAANALAAAGWEISQISFAGFVLKKDVKE
jgi:hypothetical protein